MAIYYVRPDGNNANAGTGYLASQAWATLAKAISVVAANDTVRIAPGTYRETVTCATSGGISTPITWWADKEAQYFLDLKAGYVRVTGTDANEIGQGTTNIWSCNAKTYQIVRGFVIDGNKNNVGGTGTRGILGSLTSILNDCVVAGAYIGIQTFGTVNRCISMANIGIYQCTTVNNCITIANNSFNSNTTCNNCLSIGGNYGFIASNSNNCTAIGATSAGFQSGIHTNGKAIACTYGFSSTSALATLNRCKAISCANATYGLTTANPLNISGVSASNCVNNSRGGGYDTGAVTEAKYEGFTDISRLLKMAHAFKFDLIESDTGTATAFTEDYDIEGLPRLMGSGSASTGSLDIGAHEYSNNSISYIEYKTYAPSIQINNIGIKRLVIPVKIGIEKTVSCWVKFNLDSGIDKPQMIISSREDILTVNPISSTAIGIGSNYEQLILIFIPKATGMIFVDFYNRTNGTGGLAVANFSDIVL